MNNLAPMKNCPGGVQGNLNWMPGYFMLVPSANNNFASNFNPIRRDQTSGLIWIQTDWHSDGVLKIVFGNINLEEKHQMMSQNYEKLFDIL